MKIPETNFVPRGWESLFTTKNRNLWKKSEGEPVLVTAVPLVTHAVRNHYLNARTQSNQSNRSKRNQITQLRAKNSHSLRSRLDKITKTRNSVHYSCPRFWYPVYCPRWGILGVPECIHTRTKNICWQSKKCVCNLRSILDLTKLGAHSCLG